MNNIDDGQTVYAQAGSHLCCLHATKSGFLATMPKLCHVCWTCLIFSSSVMRSSVSELIEKCRVALFYMTEHNVDSACKYQNANNFW